MPRITHMTLRAPFFAASVSVGLSASIAMTGLAHAGASVQVFLAKQQWQTRLLVLNAATAHSALIESQKVALAGHDRGICDRHIRLLTITDQAVYFEGVAVNLAVADLRQHLQLVGAVVLLIGKDGGIKRRRSAAISAQDLFMIIDGMAMRQAEMRASDDRCEG